MAALATLGLLALAACGAAPTAPASTATAAALALPERWPLAEAHGAAPPPDADWWARFGSPDLQAQVALAQAQARDVAVAAARVQQAAAGARVAGAARLPTLDATLDSRRDARLAGAPTLVGPQHALGLMARYEVDLWGRVAAVQQAADARWQASVHELSAARLSAGAAVAHNWLEIAGLHERARIAAASLHSAERLLALTESRARAGAATALDLARQRGLVATQRGALEALRQQQDAALARQQVLLGSTAVQAPAPPSLASLAPPALAAGLPAQLLTRRPDIAQAQARLAAADADVATARAAQLPQLDLRLGLGSGAARWGALLDHPAWSLAAGLAAPLFDGGRRQAVHAQAQALRDEARAEHRQAVVAAVAEVQAALQARDALARRRAANAEALAQARQALQLAESRWRAGAEDQLALLDAQRALHAVEDDAAQLQQAALQAAVDLYRALGGGWEAAPAGA